MKNAPSLFVLILSFGFLFLQTDLAFSQANKKPQKIILMIGDGMGLAQVSSLIYYKKDNVNIERFPYTGFVKTSSFDSKITDSAAGATSMASGVKTYNGAIGMDKDTISVPTILEISSKAGKSTGLVSTSSITHATPASFFAHQPKRSMEEEIAYDMIGSPVDVFLGGGLKFFTNRKDGLNLTDSLKKNGFSVYTSAFPAKQKTSKVAYFAGEVSVARADSERGDFLTKSSRFAIDKLNMNKKGFFLMVEGSQIDWGGHDNDSSYVVSEMIDFDNTIGAVLDFAEKDGNTLVIVTADHETGGMALTSFNGDYNTVAMKFNTKGHTGTMVPIFAYGPGAEMFTGVFENTEIFKKMKELFGLK
ncbi:MAG TPA: alkaline phosphatase [Cytophagales bacterium]|nr:alkaline phosphatase [Cytophagales bacterium]